MHTINEHSKQLITRNSYIQCNLDGRRKWHSVIINSSVDSPFTKGYAYLFLKARRNATFIFKILILQNTQVRKCLTKEINLLWTDTKTYLASVVFILLIAEVLTYGKILINLPDTPIFFLMSAFTQTR